MNLGDLLRKVDSVNSGKSFDDVARSVISSGSKLFLNGENLRECIVCGKIFNSSNEGEKGSHHCSDECWLDDLEDLPE